MSIFEKLGSNVKANNFKRAEKQEAQALSALLKIDHFKDCPHEALYKCEPSKGTYICTADGRELPKPDLLFYMPEGVVLIDVKNVPTVLSRDTYIDKATRDKKHLSYIPINSDIIDPYKEVAQIMGAIEVLILFAFEGDFYLTAIDNCDKWDGLAGNKKLRDQPVYQYYFEDCQPNSKKLKGIYKL